MTLRWQINWKLTAFSVALLPLLLSLGVWQLQRAEEKQALLDSYQERREAPAVSLPPAAGDQRYRRVRVTGRFDNQRLWLLDNRLRDGRPGYEVVAPFTSGETTVLVNRGWLPAPPTREQLPAIAPVTGAVTLIGWLTPPSQAPLELGEPVHDGWPRVVQSIHLERVEQALGAPVYPWELRLAEDAPGALDTGWPIINLSPAMHTGYAVQWFAMAAALSLLWLLTNTNLWALLRARGTDANDD